MFLEKTNQKIINLVFLKFFEINKTNYYLIYFKIKIYLNLTIYNTLVNIRFLKFFFFLILYIF